MRWRGCERLGTRCEEVSVTNERKITPQSAAKVAAGTDLALAWLWFSSAPEGSAERKLSEVLRRRGVSAVLRGLDITRDVLVEWRAAKAVPLDRVRSLEALHVAMFAEPVPLATQQRLGVGKIDMQRARELRGEGVKLAAIAAEMDVTKQAVSKALKKAKGAEGGS